MLSTRRLALQGFGFRPTAVSIAVQGLLSGSSAVEPPVLEQPRAAIIGRGPGTTINLSTYLASLKRGYALPPVHTSAHLKRKRANQRRQRQILAATQLTEI